MNGRLHIILGTPESERRSLLSKFTAKDEQSDPACFLLPPELESMSMPHSNWIWNQNKFEFGELPVASNVEYFLFFSNEVNLAEQFEAVLEVLAEEEDLSMGRVILFINSILLPGGRQELMAWIDAAGHFSDAICFIHRNNENAMAISKCKERFETMRYPLETYVLGGKKVGVLEKILHAPPRRITHLFDPPDLLDEDDAPQNDPYLAKLANGRRERPVPSPFGS
jgi:hypothetical protein